MATVRKTIDPFPLYPEAGKHISSGDSNTKICVSPA